MGTRAGKTVARCERLLRAVGRGCGHVVTRPHDGTRRVTIGNVLAEDQKLTRAYVSGGKPDRRRLLHDLQLLAEYGRIDFDIDTGPHDDYGTFAEGDPATWIVLLQTGGLEHLLEAEKSWIRRAYEKDPPAWWMVALTLAAT